MSAASQLAVRYPWIIASMDPSTVAAALTLAFDYRPMCLTEAQQDAAQAHYAAWVLSSGTSDASGPVKSETEGGVSRTYMSGQEAGFATTPYGAWSAMWRMCSAGGFVVSSYADPRKWP